MSDMNGTGEVFDSSAGFTIPNGATRSPDTAWILADRWNVLSQRSAATGDRTSYSNQSYDNCTTCLSSTHIGFVPQS